MKPLLRTPAVVNLELTEVCNVSCSHCYNPWRAESMGEVSLEKARLDEMIDRLVGAGVFHVVLTGGEPMSKFKNLTHALRRLAENNISTSCNSNLMLATDARCKELRALGLDHILTSLPSCEPDVTDAIMNKIGAYEKIMEGIENAVNTGIRVSVNMVISRTTAKQVYRTGELVAAKGVQKLFVTRAVPPHYASAEVLAELQPPPEEVIAALDDALRVKEDFGIMIGTLVSYPLCFLGDLEKYRDFVGRGCPGQSGQLLSIHATGETHSCVHETDGPGNVLEKSVEEVFNSASARAWHSGTHHYVGCEGCHYIDVCATGCRMTSLGVNGTLDGKDPLFAGKHAFTREFDIVTNEAEVEMIDDGASFIAPQRLRFRKEDGFFLLNIRWANSIRVNNDVAKFLVEHHESGMSFTAADFGLDRKDYLEYLLFKDVVEMVDQEISDLRRYAGLGLDNKAPLIDA